MLFPRTDLTAELNILSLVYYIFSFKGGRYGNRLRYVAIVVNTSLTGATLKYNLGKRVYNNWEKYIKEQVRLS